MKKQNVKAFTLVEMLIVIVIIGILIAALLPRLQGAQAMARDTYRQTALSQVGAGLSTYYAQFGKRPNSASSTIGGIKVTNLSDLTSQGILTNLPKDRIVGSTVSGFTLVGEYNHT